MSQENTYFKWVRMGVSPVTGMLRHIGAVDELPAQVGAMLKESGHVIKAGPDEIPFDGNLALPSKIVGINISEEEYERGEHLRKEREEVTKVKPRKSSGD